MDSAIKYQLKTDNTIVAPQVQTANDSGYFRLEVRIRAGDSWTDPRTGRIYVNHGQRSIRFWLLTRKPTLTEVS